MPDLTTDFKIYITTLKTASPLAVDVTTLVAKDLATARTGNADLDDANTMYATFLPPSGSL